MPVIIGVTGLAFAGKDTVGKYLVENYGFVRKGFADKLKESVAALFGITREQVDEFKWHINTGAGTLPPVEVIVDINGKTQYSFEWREFLQRYGTESHREVFGYNFWVDQLLNVIPYPDRMVITDVRFNNEAQAIWELGGRIVKVFRSASEKELASVHVSEQGIDPDLIDYELWNDGSLEDLYVRIHDMMQHFGWGE